jgi:acyl dehydratase
VSLNSLLLNDIVIGQTVEYVWQVTVEQIDQFALLSGDYNPLHVSAEYAVSNGYQDRVAHGFLFGAQLSGIIGIYHLKTSDNFLRFLISNELNLTQQFGVKNYE